MNLSDFDFALPPDRIAHEPARPREAARLLAVGDALSDHHVCDLPDLLRPGDLLVGNDTRVIPAQLHGRRGDAAVAITLDQPRDDGSWHALARNARRLRPGDTIRFTGDLCAEIESNAGGGSVVLRFNRQDAALDVALAQAGTLALPPYIDRPDGPRPEDAADYQTVFARHPGAVAAPTAGLHFTPALLARLEAAGVAHATVTLHVGAGTFLPVRDDDLSAHTMHPERGHVSAELVERIRRTRAAGGRVVAVGTTSLRVLETAAASGSLAPFDGQTSLFILPGHRFQVVDRLITNFHLPRSTLFMLVCAFAGKARMQDAYAHAIAARYRFYSYGDACLLDRAA